MNALKDIYKRRCSYVNKDTLACGASRTICDDVDPNGKNDCNGPGLDEDIIDLKAVITLSCSLVCNLCHTCY